MTKSKPIIFRGVNLVTKKRSKPKLSLKCVEAKKAH